MNLTNLKAEIIWQISRRGEDNIKMDLKEVWIRVAQDRVLWQAFLS
jgi:hypothetical protein